MKQNNSSGEGRLISSILILIWVLSYCFVYFSKKARRDFWSTDVSLFWRYAEDPEAFASTSPVLASVLSSSPSYGIDFFTFLVSRGYTQEAGYFIFNPLSCFFAITLVCVGFYNFFRSLSYSRVVSAVGVMLATLAPIFISYSRLHPLQTVMTHGGLSMFAISITIFSVGLYVRGRSGLACSIVSLVPYVHIVTGFLGMLLVYSGIFIDRLKGWSARSVTFLVFIGASMVALALPVMLRVVNLDAEGMLIDRDIYFSFVNARSSNPMPLRDGIDHVFTHVIVFLSALRMVGSTYFGAAVSKRVRWILWFWLLCYSTQIIVSDFYHSPGLTSIVFNRFSPILFFVFAGITVAHLFRLWGQGRLFSVFILLVLFALAGAETRLFSHLHTIHLAASALLITLIVSVTDVSRDKLSSVRVFIVVAAILFSAMYLGPVAIGMGSIKYLNWKLVGFVILVFLFYRFLLPETVKTNYCVLKDRFFTFTERRGTNISVAIFLILFKLALTIPNIPDLVDPNYKFVRFYSRSEAVDLVRKNTDEDRVIHSQISIDLNGVRKQFIDWKHEWYALYYPRQITNIQRRLELLGINIISDPEAEKVCGGYRWVFIGRCVTRLQDVVGKIQKYDWRDNWPRLIAFEPKLVGVLIWSKDLTDRDEIVARSEKFALVVPK